MPFHRCTVAQTDGTIVATNIALTLEEPAGKGAPGWYGTLTVTHLTLLEAGKSYRLTLDDGRAGEFAVRRNTVAGGEHRAVAINGSGALG